MAEIKKGDRVRVTIEATVEMPYEGGLYVATKSGGGSYISLNHEDIKVEVLPPPVEQFKPGDVVRDKNTGTIRALGDGGYVNLKTGRNYAYGGGVTGLEAFTSAHYERVEV